LTKVAQVVVDAMDSSIGTVNAGECATSSDITVPGLQDLEFVMVIPGVAGVWGDPEFVLGGYGPSGSSGSNTVQFQACNVSGGALAPDPLSVRILGFG